MTKKGNIRSIRFSDEMAELINQQIGDTFTAKFESLITKCVWELPNKERQLTIIQAQIDREGRRLRELSDEVYKFRSTIDLLNLRAIKLDNLIQDKIKELQS